MNKLFDLVYCLGTWVFLLLLNCYLISIFLDMVGRFKETDAGRLRAEYNRLVEGLAQRGNLPSMLCIIVIEARLHEFFSL